jgi:aminopeptidase N
MASLTAREAALRASSVKVRSYDVELDLTRGDTEFGSRTTIEFASLDHQDTWLDVRPADLLSVRLNGRPLDVTGLYDGRLHLTGLEDDNDVVVDALMHYSHDGEGMHRAVDPEDKQAYVYAMAFLDAAPRIFACFDQPDLKAPYRMRVKAPSDWTVLGNGRAQRVADGEWELAETRPLATYFATVVAGPYHSVLAEHDGIQLGLHCRQSLAAHLDKDAEELLDVTRSAFDEYHRLFGIRYPFGDYHQVWCPEFNAGAMENPGCVTHSDTFVFKALPTDTLRSVRAEIVVHEMAHQWFGDLVTMTWWDDLWLNESFADYMGYRVTHDSTDRFKQMWAEFAFIRKSWGMAADQRSSTHPVAGNGARDTQAALTDFDGISYCKGAAALRQLASFLGDDAFIGGVVDHLRRHAFGNARLGDLLDAWAEASDADVRAWAESWLRTSGIDTLEVVRRGAEAPVIRLTDGSPQPAGRQHAVTVGWYAADGRVEQVPVVVGGDETPVPFEQYDGTGFLLPDCGDETWAKVVLDPQSMAEVAEALPRIDDLLGRAVVWAALREALLDARVSPSAYLDVVESALPAEADIAVEAVLRDEMRHGATSSTAVYLTAAPAHRSRVAAVAEQILAAAEPASNRQLVVARTFVSTTDDMDLVARWRDGDVPDGLLLDDDLRWRLTRRLAQRGLVSADDIDLEARRDPSSHGVLAAMTARASLPDPGLKEHVWRQLLDDDALTNYELFALAQGFFATGQDELTAPYRQRYFDELPVLSERRSGMVADRLAELLFPRNAVTEQTLGWAREVLAASDLSPQVRRPVSDHTDDLARALASRQRFGW